MTTLRRLLGCCLLTGLAACQDGLAPGELGIVRYFGNVGGEVPLALVPPISDRAGNAYVLYGDPEETEAAVWVGHAGGGWTSSCKVISGTSSGVHGWVGRTQDRAYYWAGGALVRVSGRNGGCKQILKRDPSSGAALDFLAVAPWVEETPSRARTVAWVRSAADVRPFQVEVDLEVGTYTSSADVGADGRTDYEVLGVGADSERRTAMFVFRYREDEQLITRARVLDMDAETQLDVSVVDADELAAYSFVGNLVPVADGRFVGLASDGRLLVVDSDGGRFRQIKGMAPAGIHRWRDATFIVGTKEGKPVVSKLDESAEQRKVTVWEASVTADAALQTELAIRDDRSLPSRSATWLSPRSATGKHPFVGPFSLDSYATDTTLWLIAGPDFEAGGETRTAVALAPMGVVYP